MLCFALAYGLITLGIWPWAAFLIVAGTLRADGRGGGGDRRLLLQRLSGLRKTRETVTEGIGMLRQEVEHPDGQQPELTPRETR